MKLSVKQKAAYGFGAIGKDMVYALSSGYILYYYQDILGVNAAFVGIILMIARVFDAVNDPLMGIVVAKTNTRWGKLRPWIFTGTILNAFVLYALFAAPSSLSSTGIMIWFAVTYILWGTTYTIMDIPYWSVIPAVTDSPKDRENLSVIARSCAGVGNAIITISTMLVVGLLGGGDSASAEIKGFKIFALIVAVIFVISGVVTFLGIKEKKSEKMKTATVGEMFKALFSNDQAIAVVVTIVLVNTALYITSNLIIYFFKYDIGGGSDGWKGNYTLFTAFGGGMQIIAMMIIFPIIRKFLKPLSVFKLSLGMAVTGYILILVMALTGISDNILLLCIPGLLVFSGNGMLTVLTTMFLANTVDYGELKNGRREESVIFSMQTFVVKLASGVSSLVAGLGLTLIGLQGNSDDGMGVTQSASSILGLRLLMTVIPIVLLLTALFFFTKKYVLTESKLEEISKELKSKRD